MNEYVDCSKVYVDKCEYGFGVFAKEDIEANNIIEKGLIMVMKNVINLTF